MSAYTELDRRSNGGDAIVCYDKSKNITSVELLDFYERPFKRDMGPGDSWEKKIRVD
jgi:hypothetical protein